MGSGAIYAVIVGLWAVVLIPLWLRNHERSGETRTIDRYHAAMSSMSDWDGRRRRRAESRSQGRAVSAASGGGGRSVSKPVSPSVSEVEADDEPMWSVPPSPAEVAASRRRLVLFVLVGLTVASLALTLLGVLPVWFILLPLVLLIAFSAVSRQQVRAAEQASLKHSRATRDQAARKARVVDQPGDRRATPRSKVAYPAQHIDSLPEVRRSEALNSDSLTISEGDPNGWAPVSAPLPTYVTAPRASRVPRVIDLTHTGEWGGDAMVNEARRVRADDSFSKNLIEDEINRALNVDDDAFFDQLAAETHRPRRSADFFDQDAPRAVND